MIPPTSWAKTFSSTGGDRANALVVDPLGNVFATGSFESNAALAGEPFASAGQSDVFVASFDPRGAVRWVRRFGGVGVDAGKAIALLPEGRVAVAGVFDGAVDFGDGLEPGAGTGSFVMALSDDGALAWVSTMRGADLWAISAGSSGRLFVELTTSALVTFDDGETRSSAGSPDTLLVAYSEVGQRTWSRPYGGAGVDVPGGVSSVGDDIYIAMATSGPVDLGGGSLPSIGSVDLVVARVAGSDGSHQWSRRYGSAGSTTPASVTASSAGVAVVGCFGQTLDVGPSSAQAIGGQDSFITMIDTVGTPRWLASVGATGFDCATTASTVDGGVIVGGSFVGDLVLDGNPMPSAGDADLWLAEYTDTGVLRARRRSGGVGTDAVTSIAKERGYITLGGSFGGDTSVLGHLLEGVGGTDGFVLQSPE